MVELEQNSKENTNYHQIESNNKFQKQHKCKWDIIPNILLPHSQ
jgi:hypothetical protein